VLHILTVESLPLYVFYVSFLDVLTSFWAFCYMWGVNDERHHPGHFAYCVLNDFWFAILHLNADYKGECIVLHGQNWSALAHISCAAVVISTQFLLASKALKGGADVCLGSFYAREWEAQETHFYKGLAIFMGVCTLIAIVFTMVMSDFNHQEHSEMIWAFLWYRSGPLFVLVVNSFCLASRRPPEFDYDSEEFENRR